jgi:hypothetical protein
MRVNDYHSPLRILPPVEGEDVMPFDSMLVSAAVIAVFVVFAAVLIWADF